MTSVANVIESNTGYGHKDSNSSSGNAEEANTSNLSRDEKDMRRMGKVQETKVRYYNDGNTFVPNLKQRNFGLLPLLGVSLSFLGVDNGVDMSLTVLEVHNNHAELLGISVSVSFLTT
jgi:hypothetical protein